MLWLQWLGLGIVLVTLIGYCGGLIFNRTKQSTAQRKFCLAIVPWPFIFGGCMLFFYGGARSVTKRVAFDIVRVQEIPTHGKLTAMVYVPVKGLMTTSNITKGVLIDNNPVGLATDMDYIPALALHQSQNQLFVSDWQKKKIRVYDVATSRLLFNITDLPFGAQSIAVGDDGWVYMSGQEDYVLCIQLATTGQKPAQMMQIQQFGRNDTFTRLRGLFYEDGLLYVADRTRIVVFRNRSVVKYLTPIIEGRKMVLWQNMLVVAQTTQMQFFTVTDGRLLATIAGSCFEIACSPTHLYTSSGDRLMIYTV